MAAEARVISLTAPGYTHTLEFDDGKLMFGKVQSLNAVTWERLLERVAGPGLAPMYEDADVIGFVNWTMLPYATDIWRRFAAEVLPRLTRRPIAFFDLADPHKRSKEDLREALQVLETFQAHCAVYLGLNRKEAAEVARALGIEGAADATVELEAATRGIGEVLDIEGVVVHPTERAGAYVRGEYVEVAGPYTPKPKLTTGAGDNFNAGLCLGLALGFTLQEALTLAPPPRATTSATAAAPRWNSSRLPYEIFRLRRHAGPLATGGPEAASVRRVSRSNASPVMACTCRNRSMSRSRAARRTSGGPTSAGAAGGPRPTGP